MSLFQFGFTNQAGIATGGQQVQNPALSHMPSLEESGLRRLEYDTVSGSTVSDLTDPSPAKKRRKRGSILSINHSNVPVLVNMLWKMVRKELGYTICVNSLI